MKFARSDYDKRIVDTANKIPDNEPCFLLRGQDSIAPRLLLMWAMELRLAGGDPAMAESAEHQAQDMINWQRTHVSKTPDLFKDSFKQDVLRDSLKFDLNIISTGDSSKFKSFDISDFQSRCNQYYGYMESLYILMPNDLINKDYDDFRTLKLSNFNLTSTLAESIAKAKIVLFIDRNRNILILKSEI